MTEQISAKCARCGGIIKDGDEIVMIQIARIEKLPWTAEDGYKSVMTGSEPHPIHYRHVVEEAERTARAGAAQITNVQSPSFSSPSYGGDYGASAGTGLALGVALGIAIGS